MPNLIKNLREPLKDIFRDEILTAFLIILLVVGINQIVFSYLLVNRDLASAATVDFTEDFTTDTYKDNTATTGLWDPTIDTQAQLWGKGWTNMAETAINNFSGVPPDSFDTLDMEVKDIKLDNNNYPHIVGEKLVGSFYEIYYTQWNGDSWTGADGIDDDGDPSTADYDVISASILLEHSHNPKLILDPNDNYTPHIVWEQGIVDREEIYYAKWDGGSWADPDNNDGIVNVSNLPGYPSTSPQMVLDSSGNPYIVWVGDISGSRNRVLFLKWTSGVGFTTIHGSLPATDSQKVVSGADADLVDDKVIQMDSFDMPAIAWSEGLNGEIWYGKAVSSGFCAPETVCWVNLEENTWGFEQLTSAGHNNKLVEMIEMGGQPFLLWLDTTDGQLYFMTGSATAGWTDMAGNPGPENVARRTTITVRYAAMMVSPDTVSPYIVHEDGDNLYITKWDNIASGWRDMNGNTNTLPPPDDSQPSYELIYSTTDPSKDPQLYYSEETEQPIIIWNENDSEFVMAQWRKYPPGSATGDWYNMDMGLLSSASWTTLPLGTAAHPYQAVFSVTPPDRGYPYVIKLSYFYKWIPYNTTNRIQSLNINTGGLPVDQAEFNVVETVNPTYQAINYYLSNDGGASWEAVTSGSIHTFATPGGTDVRWAADLQITNTSYNHLTPTIDSVTVGLVTTNGGTTGSRNNSGVLYAYPSAPANLGCEVGTNTIRWLFEDTADNETGFRLYGPQGLIKDSGPEIAQDWYYIEETGLQPNTLYEDRYITTYNGAGESSPSGTISCTTLAAQEPLPSPEEPVPETEPEPEAEPEAQPEPEPEPEITLPLGINVGDVIQQKGSATLYLVSSAGQRRPFPNEKIYMSWFTDFSQVKVIDNITMSQISIGTNMILRPGTWLMKTISSAKVYAVEPQGIIRWIETEEIASALYGLEWNKRIIDMPDPYFADYTQGTSISSAQYATGTLLQYVGSADTYYIVNNTRRYVSPQAFSQNNFQQKFVIIDVDLDMFTYELGDPWPVDYDYTMTMTEVNKNNIHR